MKNILMKLAQVNGMVSISGGIATLDNGTTIDLKSAKKPRVLITVSGGVADWVCDEGADVEKFDFDGYKVEEEGRRSGVSAHFADLAYPIAVPVVHDVAGQFLESLDHGMAAATNNDFNPQASFASLHEALEIIWKQEDPLAALLAIVKANVEVDECGFASEIVASYLAFDPNKSVKSRPAN